jgi:hypothetical protein
VESQVSDYPNITLAPRCESVRLRRAYAELGSVGYTRAVKFSHAMRPAGWFASALLFGVPALVFAFLFHWLGPHLVQQGTSWWRIFHLLLILPLSLMLVAALCGAALEVKFPGWKGLIERLRFVNRLSSKAGYHYLQLWWLPFCWSSARQFGPQHSFIRRRFLRSIENHGANSSDCVFSENQGLVERPNRTSSQIDQKPVVW